MDIKTEGLNIEDFLTNIDDLPELLQNKINDFLLELSESQKCREQ